MRAMKGTEAEMDDADLGLERRFGRQNHPGRDRVERSAGETLHPAPITIYRLCRSINILVFRCSR